VEDRNGDARQDGADGLRFFQGAGAALQDWPSVIVEETGMIRETMTHNSAGGNRKLLKNAAGLYNDFLMLL